MRFYLLFLLVPFLSAGCAGQSLERISTGERYSVTSEGVEGYVLGTGDVLKVDVFREPSLSGNFAVGASGTISLALIGEVQVADRTTPEVESQIESALARGYLRDPEVSVSVAEYRPFFILGEVAAPGQYPYSNGLTVMNAVATARGFTARAQRKQVFIRRMGESEEKLYSLTPNLLVYPGDTIRLGERYF